MPNVSTSDPFDDIIEFHRKFDLLPDKKALLSNEMLEFRDKFFMEETREFFDAHIDEKLEEALDACVDIMYIALGAMVLMGFTAVEMRKAWFRIHEANMKKVRASSAMLSKRGSPFDVVKPKGWEPPDLSDLCKQPRES